MDNIVIEIGEVKQVETTATKEGFDGLRVRAVTSNDNTTTNSIPWAFPLLPKVFQSVPQEGDAVLIFRSNSGDNKSGNRYYLGPIISQPQNFGEHDFKKATSLLDSKDTLPREKISDSDDTRGAFPKTSDVAVVGRGKEDIILRYTNDTSEVSIRSGIRNKPTNSDNPNMVGNIIFNNVNPAYIQLKYKQGLATHEKNKANSIINIVSDRINIMSNNDENVAYNIHNKETLVEESKMDDIMDKLHPLPKGDELVKLLKLIVGAIMHHVHPWAGMEQCGDWSGFIKELEGYDIDKILSEYVRIS